MECASSPQRERERKVDSEMWRGKERWIRKKSFIWTRIFFGTAFPRLDCTLRFPWQQPYLAPAVNQAGSGALIAQAMGWTLVANATQQGRQQKTKLHKLRDFDLQCFCPPA